MHRGGETLEQVRAEAVAAALSSETREVAAKGIAHSQYRRLLDGLTIAAKNYAERLGMNVDEFRHGSADQASPLQAARDVVWDLRYALVQSEKLESRESLDFWRHETQPLWKVREKKTPYIHREYLESAVGAYLALPFRWPDFDRLLVDVLVAAEMYGFAEEMINEQTFGLFAPRSPLKQRHALLSYLATVATVGLVFLGMAAVSAFAGAKGWIGEGFSSGLALLFSGLFVIIFLWESIALPINWRAQKKAKEKVLELMSAMFGLYPELSSAGPISAAHIRERLSEIEKLGVVWPGPLYAVLDDVLKRGGRL